MLVGVGHLAIAPVAGRGSLSSIILKYLGLQGCVLQYYVKVILCLSRIDGLLQAGVEWS